MADRSVSVTLRAEVSGYVAQMRVAQQATSQFVTESSNYIEKNKKEIGDLTTMVGLLGGAMVGFAGLAVKAFADWDAKMAQVQTLSKATATQMAALRDATRGFATDFGVSASQAADAELELVKAGISVADITGGALKGALTLASAGQLDVADATSIAASAMTQFGLKGQDVSHIADVLAAGADKALGSVQDLGEGLKYAGPVASSLGVSLDTTVGVLSEFAQAGIIGQQAGTGLRGSLLALTAPSDAAAKVMDKYGISLFDAQGKFVGLSATAGQLHDKLGNLNQAQQQAALGTIFGNQQITTATILMKNGAAGVDQWTKAVNDQGFAADQASGKLNSLNGDIEKFKATFSNAMVDLGSSGNSPLRAITQDLTGLIEYLEGLPGVVKSAFFWATAGGGVLLLATAGLGKVAVSVVSLNKALVALGIVSEGSLAKVGGLTTKVGLLGAAITVGSLAIIKGVDALSQLSDHSSTASKSVDEITRSLQNVPGSSNINDLFKFSDGAAADKINNVTDALDALTGSGTINKLNLWGSKLDDLFHTSIIGNVKDAKESFSNVDDELTGLVSSGNVTQAAHDFDTLYASVDQNKYSVADVMKLLPGYTEALKANNDTTSTAAAATDANTDAIDQYTSALATGTQTSEDYTSAIKEQADALQKAAGIPLTARQATRDYQQSIDDATAALKKNGATLDVHTAKGRDNQAALDKIAQSAFDVVDAYAAEGASTKTLQGKMADGRAEFVKTAEQMGLSKGAAKKLADQLGLIPKNVKVDVDASTKKAGDKLSAFNQSLLNFHAPVIPIDASLANAQAALNAFRSGVNNTPLYLGVSAIPQHAGGGRIYGPGGPTDDNVLIAASPGEFVVNAASYSKYGPLVDAINSGSIPAFAQGGKVPTSYKGKSLEYWQGKYASGTDYLRLQQSIKDDKSALAEKEKYGKDNKLSRYVLRGIDRRVEESQLKDDRQALADANTARGFVAKYGSFASAIKARDKAKDAKDAAAQKQKDATAAAAAKSAANASAKSDLTTSVRRGDISSAVSGGIDSALGVVDQAITESKDTNLTKSQRSSLAAAAAKAEPALTKLYKQADLIQTALGKAQDHLADMQQIASAASDTVKGTFNLSAAYNQSGTQHTDAYGNTWYDTSTQGYTGAGIESTAAAQAATAQQFASALSKLQGKLGSSPASSAIVQQALSIFGSDPAQGLQFVQALNGMSTSDLNSVKSSYNTIASAGTSAGQSASAADTIGGLTAATTAVNTLTTSLNTVNTSITKVGNTLTDAMLKPYGLKLDAKGNVVKRALGGWVRGAGTSTSDSIHLAASNGEFVVNAAAAAKYGPVLEAINSGRAGFANATPAASTLSTQPAPIYVQNPFTGEYLLAKVSTVAGKVVAAHTAAEDSRSAYVRS